MTLACSASVISWPDPLQLSRPQKMTVRMMRMTIHKKSVDKCPLVEAKVKKGAAS